MPVPQRQFHTEDVSNPQGQMFIWVCENGHYLAMSSQGKYPPRMGTAVRSLTERHYQRMKERGDHDHEPCPHCKNSDRKRYVVTAMGESDE